jgi:hypothetical protein
MSWAEQQAALEECDAYERDRWSENEGKMMPNGGLYPDDFNRWYDVAFVKSGNLKRVLPQQWDFHKKQQYKQWKARQWKAFYGSANFDEHAAALGAYDEVSDAWQDLDRAHDDGNGMLIGGVYDDVEGLPPGFQRFLRPDGRPRPEAMRLQGTVTGRFSSDDPPPVSQHVRWETAKKRRSKPKVSQLTELKKQLNAILTRIADLENRPPEPTDGLRFSEGEYLPPVVYMKKMFTDTSWQTGKRYDYAFIKAGNGYWYGTGPHAPQKKTWDELMDWIESTGPWPTIYELNPKDGQTGVYWSPENRRDTE